ncbi:hypothetical protein MAE02_69060 [Microvirga aerophila]|uniref:Uncharacterized protein n=2 Tax=Microvirga aerophila TaxID=670291 RepID=A0A512C4X1_9HYPH|nr:hypothetical protein MAE02_69060 [Microvirga aerophila]
MDVAPLRFFNMPILARPTLVEGAIHDITFNSIGRIEADFVAGQAQAAMLAAEADKLTDSPITWYGVALSF